jgi:hypothetical protein
MSQIDSLVSTLEELVRSGNLGEARRLLLAADAGKIPRRYACRVANLARRCGQFKIALRVLNPYVEEKAGAGGNDLELAEYALTLGKLGAPAEALRVIRRVRPAACPKQPFYEALILFSLWEYSQAIPLIGAYMRNCAGDSYEWAVAAANMVAALTFSERLHEAEELCRRITESSRRQNFKYLLSSCLELSAQIRIAARDFAGASARLEESAREMADPDSLPGYFIRKWQAVAEVSAAPGESSIRRLAAARAEGLRREQWESVRDCDLYLAAATGDSALFLRVYFGTPNEKYRGNMLKLFTPEGGIPSAHTLFFPADQETGNLLETRELGKQALKLFGIVAADIYRPARVAHLFFSVFEESHFNPISSPNRVHQAVHRANAQLRKTNAPVQLENLATGYRLNFSAPAGLIYETQARTLPAPVLKLREKWPGGDFSAREAREHLGVSNGAINKILRGEIENGRMVVTGSGRFVKYRIAS